MVRSPPLPNTKPGGELTRRLKLSYTFAMVMPITGIRRTACEFFGKMRRNTLANDVTFERGTHFTTQSEAVQALKRWFEETDEETIGDTSFARAPWINFDSPTGVVDLNADTNRRGVQRMLQQTRTNRNEPWHVIENQRGKINKVVFNLNDTHEGWYAYLREPLSAPTTI